MFEINIHETNYSDRQSNVQAQHGGRKAAGAEHIGNTNEKYWANSDTISKTGKKINFYDLLADKGTITLSFLWTIEYIGKVMTFVTLWNTRRVLGTAPPLTGKVGSVMGLVNIRRKKRH